MRGQYPTLTFVESSGGWIAEQGDLAGSGSTSYSALYDLARKQDDTGYQTPDDLCHYCDGAGDFMVSVRNVGNGWSQRMTHPHYPIRVECSYCAGTGYSDEAIREAAQAESEWRRDWEAAA